MARAPWQEHRQPTGDKDVYVMLDAETETAARPGLFRRLVAAVRGRIRRLFRKDDPNIYPFF